MKQYRQGDVLIQQVKELPYWIRNQTSEKRKEWTLALGEATGHAHVLEADVMETWGQPQFGSAGFVEVGGTGGVVTHQEHETIELEPGIYTIVHQREYAGPNQTRAVFD